MNKVINYIHIYNMFSHNDRRFEFSPGKNFIIGSVGKGKSLIIEAICFSFFGVTALRGKSSDFDKALETEMSFSFKDETFLLNRKLTDATLKMYNPDSDSYEEIANSTSVVNQFIINLLGYNYEIFLLSNYCKQKKLSYFSELTPAKRLQYIDKISGIEDSKEYSAYLLSLRKSLREQVALLGDLAKEPVLPEEVDLNKDYQKELDLINLSLDVINSLYDQFHEYSSKSINSLEKPNNPLNSFSSSLLLLSEEEIEKIEKNFEEIDSLSSHISALERSLRSFRSFPIAVDHFSLEAVEENIDYLQSTVSEKDSEIICPSCSFSFKPVSEIPVPSVLIPLNLNELKDLKDYIINNSKEAIKELKSEINQKELIIEELYDLTKIYRDKKFLHLELNDAKNKSLSYQEALEEYNNREQVCETFRKKASEIQLQIDTYLNQQSETLKIKESLMRLKIEKEVYLERLEIFNKTNDKFNSASRRLDLVNILIKDLLDITHRIKTETIPLINFYASDYLNLVSRGAMSSLEVTDSYDLIVDGHNINLKSGGQQDLSSLAFRLSLSKSVIPGMLPLIMLDEVDSAGSYDSVNDILVALETITDNFQTIVITHKDISNESNCNIIHL